MAENVNHETPDSWCYDDDPTHCAAYGRLYTWEAPKTACPTGWHLPSEAERFALERHLGMTEEETLIFHHRGEGQGTKLKSDGDWASHEGTDPGNNETGFSALPGGHRVFHNGRSRPCSREGPGGAAPRTGSTPCDVPSLPTRAASTGTPPPAPTPSASAASRTELGPSPLFL